MVNDIVYRFNSLGYRGSEFGEQADVRLLSIGCSWTFGTGVPQAAIYHERFAERLRHELGRSVVNWNLGVPGTSGDYIARVLHLAIPELNPDLVLILFPGLARREYVAAHGHSFNYSPTWESKDLTAQEIARHFAALSSEYDDVLNFYRNYKSVHALLGDRLWLFSFVQPDALHLIADHLDLSRQAGAHRVVDKARDDGHPGPQSHDLICQAFWDKFVTTGGVENLRLRAG